MTDTTESPNYRRTLLELPAEVEAAFTRLRASGDTGTRNRYAQALRDAHWTLQAISEAAGITRERVRQVVAEADTVDPFDRVRLPADLPLPTPPEHERKAPREFVEPDPVKLQEALDLQLRAQARRGRSDKNVAEAERYSALLADMHLNDGVPVYRLSLRLSEHPEKYGKASHSAIRFRLARYKYKAPKSGTSKVYDPIKSRVDSAA